MIADVGSEWAHVSRDFRGGEYTHRVAIPNHRLTTQSCWCNLRKRWPLGIRIADRHQRGRPANPKRRSEKVCPG